MGFSELLESIFGSSQDEKNYKSNAEAINVLSQGLKHLQTKNKQIRGNRIGQMMEGFATPKALVDATNVEKKHLSDMEKDYNRAITAYANEYKQFMNLYNTANNNRINCLKGCMKKHTSTSTQGVRLRESCLAGCNIKGPYVSQCSDTYSGWQQDTSKKCSKMTTGKCNKGKIELGQASYVNNSSYADSKSRTLASGCCDCGGGSGGPPKSKIKGKYVSNCDEIHTAFGLQKGQSASQPLIDACKTADYTDQNKSATLYLEYNKLKTKNDNLMAQANNIWNKINKLKGIRKGINNILRKEEKGMKEKYNDFSNTYTKIVGLDQSGKTENTTLNAQADDAILKERSESLKYYAWIILALLVTSGALWKMNEKKK